MRARLRRLAARLRSLFGSGALDRDFDDELESHVAILTDDNLRRGMTPDEARRAALLQVGAPTMLATLHREARSVAWVESLLQDVRHAVRALKATPVVTTVAMLSLTLGIGANTAIFSILESLFLRALPVRAPEQLALLHGRTGPRTHFTNPIWEEIRDRAPTAVADALAWSSTRFDLSDGGETDRVPGLWVSGSYFRMLGVRPMLGRLITDDDDRRGGGAAGPVAVISHGFWQRRFGGAADAIGRRLTIERVSYTVVGVTEPAFFGLDVGRTFDVAVPIGTEPLVRGEGSWLDRRSNWWLQIMFRLRPDQTVRSSETWLTGLHAQVREAVLPPGWSPNDFLREDFALTPAYAGASDLRDPYRRPLLAMMVVSFLVLAVACANVINLLLTRAALRMREFSLKVALGAPRWRVLQQLLCEGALLAGAGGVLGIAVAVGGGRLLVQQLSTATNHVFLALSVSWPVLSFTLAIVTGLALLFGVVPATQVGRGAVREALVAGRTVGPRRRAIGLSQAVLVAQVTLTMVLVTGAGLFVGTLTSLLRVPLGFDPEHVLVATVDLPADVAPGSRSQLFDRLLSAAAAVPGVSSAAVSETTPLSGNTWNNRVTIVGGPTNGDEPLTYYNAITPEWFGTLRTRLLAGRDFTSADSGTAQPVAIVNETFARTFTGGRNPIGMSLQQGDTPPRLIVGMVEDAVYETVRSAVPPTTYIPFAQRDDYPPYASISIRTVADSSAPVSGSLVRALSDVNDAVGVSIRPLSDHVAASLTQERLVASLSAIFGGLALLLAALGLYGVTAYTVSQRRGEIGVRIALGAQPLSVVRSLLRRLLLLVAAGLVTGTVLSLWAGQFISALLFRVDASDPTARFIALVVVLGTALVAGGLPALRAARLDPATVLRES